MFTRGKFSRNQRNPQKYKNTKKIFYYKHSKLCNLINLVYTFTLR